MNQHFNIDLLNARLIRRVLRHLAVHSVLPQMRLAFRRQRSDIQRAVVRALKVDVFLRVDFHRIRRVYLHRIGFARAHARILARQYDRLARHAVAPAHLTRRRDRHVPALRLIRRFADDAAFCEEDIARQRIAVHRSADHVDINIAAASRLDVQRDLIVIHFVFVVVKPERLNVDPADPIQRVDLRGARLQQRIARLIHAAAVAVYRQNRIPVAHFDIPVEIDAAARVERHGTRPPSEEAHRDRLRGVNVERVRLLAAVSVLPIKRERIFVGNDIGFYLRVLGDDDRPRRVLHNRFRRHIHIVVVPIRQ